MLQALSFALRQEKDVRVKLPNIGFLQAVVSTLSVELRHQESHHLVHISMQRVPAVELGQKLLNHLQLYLLFGGHRQLIEELTENFKLHLGAVHFRILAEN